MATLDENASARAPREGGFRVVIADANLNSREIRIAGPEPTGRQILSDAGFDPADDHYLIQRLPRATRAVSLDELVDLRREGAESFVAFRTDRVYAFTINERSYEWGASTIGEGLLRALAQVADDEILLLQREGEDQELGQGDVLSLSETGTEHLRTVKRLIEVFIDGTPKKIARGVYTTEQLIEILAVAAGYLLNVVSSDGQLVTLQPGKKLRVKPEMKFISQVPGGGSS
jgi:hypothetical protein